MTVYLKARTHEECSTDSIFSFSYHRGKQYHLLSNSIKWIPDILTAMKERFSWREDRPQAIIKGIVLFYKCRKRC